MCAFPQTKVFIGAGSWKKKILSASTSKMIRTSNSVNYM